MRHKRHVRLEPRFNHDLHTKHRGDVHLGAVLKASYGNERDVRKMQKRGYQLDTRLSNDNQQIWVRPSDRRVIATIAGTHNDTKAKHLYEHQDFQTDLLFAVGGDAALRQTKRYQEADAALQAARDKYKDFQWSVLGHSLGGGIAANLARPDDQLITHSRASTIGTQLAPNEQAFRHEGDWVSATSANSPGMTTLASKESPWFAPLASHNINNLQGTNLWV